MSKHYIPALDPELRELAATSRSVPRTPNLAIFPGRAGGRFIDNNKYAFLHCHRHVPQLDCHFLTADPAEAKQLRTIGLPVLLESEQQAIDVMVQAGLVVCDDFHWKITQMRWALLHPARCLQLWHGIPLKAIGMPEINSSVNMTPEKAKFLTYAYSEYDAVASTSPFFTEHAFAKAFTAGDFPETGYPRNDVLLRKHDKFDLINADQRLYTEVMTHKRRGTTVIFYMPTFRDNDPSPFHTRALHVERMDAFAKEHNCLFVLKLHPYMQNALTNLPPTVQMADSRSDAYPLLANADILLTDYSSVYFDFLLTDKAIVFYPYDLERYIAHNRELLFDFDEMTPGHAPRTEPDLYATLADVVHALRDGHDDGYADARKKLREQSFSHPDANSGQRLAQYLLETLLPKALADSPPA